MTDEMPQAAMLAQLEQFETHVSNFAVIVATYHKELIKNGVSEDLADTLTTNFHHIWWSNTTRGLNDDL
jgi:hypothetical protein